MTVGICKLGDSTKPEVCVIRVSDGKRFDLAEVSYDYGGRRLEIDPESRTLFSGAYYKTGIAAYDLESGTSRSANRRYIMRQLRCTGGLAALAFLWLASAGTAAAADFPKGTFTLKLPDGAVWAVQFDGKGKFTVTRDGKEYAEGTYKVTKDEIEITDEKGDAKTGTYKWKFVDKKLTFTKVKDDSKGRAAALTGGAWEMKE